MKTMKTNKILVGLAAFLFAMAFVFSSCDRDTAVTGVELSTTGQVGLALGETYTLVATVLPNDATNRNVIWYSNNTAVVTVADGLVEAVGIGNARVTVTTEEGNRVAYVDFSVGAGRADVDGVTIDSVIRTATGEPIEIVMDEEVKTITVLANDHFSLRFTVSPEDTEEAVVSNRNVTWRSSNTTVLMVNAAGAVTPQAPGTAYVFAASAENPEIQDSIRITVLPVSVESVTLLLGETEVTEHDMRIHHVRIFTAILTPTGASFQDIEWTTEHISGTEGEVITLENGTVTGIGEGQVRVTATAIEDRTDGTGPSASVLITVSGIAASGVTLNETELELTIPGTFTLVPTVAPADASDQTVTWTSSNPSVATVTATGIVGAVGLGTATITATTNDGGFEATATVRVIEGPPAVCIEDRLYGLITPETVRFFTQDYWDIGNLRWSDVVVADACNKTDYYAANLAAAGITQGNFMSDCRTASPLHGGVGYGMSFFSWCAAMTHREVLCPYPWRMPTRADFQALDRHFGGDGSTARAGSGQEYLDLALRFQTEWGARRVGAVTTGPPVPEEGVVNFGHNFFPLDVGPTPTSYWQFGPERQTTGTVAAQANNRFVFEVLSGTAGGQPRGEIRAFTGFNANGATQVRCVRDN